MCCEYRLTTVYPTFPIFINSYWILTHIGHWIDWWNEIRSRRRQNRISSSPKYLCKFFSHRIELFSSDTLIAGREWLDSKLKFHFRLADNLCKFICFRCQSLLRDQSIEHIKCICKLHSICSTHWIVREHTARKPCTMTFPLFMCKMQSIRMALSVLCSTYIVPLATVILRLTSTGFGFDLLPYCLNACRTDTAFCWRLHIVPPSSIVDMFVSLPLWQLKKRNKKKSDLAKKKKNKKIYKIFCVLVVCSSSSTEYVSFFIIIIHYCHE